MQLRGYVALWLRSYVAMWLYGYTAIWLCGYVAKFENFDIVGKDMDPETSRSSVYLFFENIEYGTNIYLKT